MKNEKERKLIKNTIIVGIGTIAAKAIGFIMAPLFSKWLSVEAYGEFDLILTYISLLIPFCTLSITEALFRFLLDDLEEGKKEKIISSGVFVTITGYSIFIILYLLSSKLFSSINFNGYACVFLAAQLLFSFFGETARGLKKLTQYSLFSFVSAATVMILGTVFLRVFELGLNGILLGYSIGYIIAAVGLLISTKAYAYISIKYVSKNTILEMMGYSWPLIPNSISWWVVNTSDRLIINRFINLTANGIYAIANKIPSIVSILLSVFQVSWLQSAAENVNGEDYPDYCNRVYNKLIVSVFSICMVLASGNFLYYSILFDTKYAEAYFYTPILIVAAGISCLGQFVGGIMIAQKETKANGITNFVAALSNILINLLFVKTIGLYAASISTLVSYLILTYIRLLLIKKKVSLRVNRYSILSIVFSIFILFMIYFNNWILNWMSLILSCLIFLALNKDIVASIVRKLVRK